MPAELDPKKRAETLISPWGDDPAPRARRITGLYACLYLEDPLVFSWCGLATFVSRHVATALAAGGVGVGELLADGNLSIYASLMPDLLRARSRVPITGLFQAGFTLLLDADRVALTDLRAAQDLVDRGVGRLSHQEQREVVQPLYDEMSRTQRALLAEFLSFRLGWDESAPVLQFRGRDAADVDERIGWMDAEVLPRWAEWRRQAPDQVRADIDRIRRECGVRGDALG